MFKYYTEQKNYFDVFSYNREIITSLVEQKIIKTEMLNNYELPTSLEKIIPKIEILANGEKLLTDAIANILKIESFLKYKNSIDKNYVIGTDYIITNDVLFTSNPLSDFIKTLKLNMNEYKKDELIFSKIGYITSDDLQDIKNSEIYLKKEKYKDLKLSNLKTEHMFLDIIISSIKEDADKVTIYYKDNSLKIIKSIEEDFIEETILIIDLNSYIEFIEYIKSMFKNKYFFKNINNKKFKFILDINTAIEKQSNIEVLNIKISNLNDVNNKFNLENLSIKDQKLFEKDITANSGLLIVSSRKHIKEQLYSFLNKKVKIASSNSVYMIENSIDKEIHYAIQEKKSKGWIKNNYSDYSIIVIESISTKEELDKIYSLIGEGKFIILGSNSYNSIDAFSKIIKLSNNNELLSMVLIGIIQVDKLKKVCKKCSSEHELIKDYYYNEFAQFDNVPALNKKIKVANKDGCDECNHGYKGFVNACEYLRNDVILKDSILEKFNLKSLRIEKNSNDWEHIFDSAMNLLEKELVTSESIIKGLGIPK